MLIGGKLLRMYISRIPVKLDRNAFRSVSEVGFRPIEKAEHQGCCGRIPPESGRNRNPFLDSGTPKTGMKAGMYNLEGVMGLVRRQVILRHTNCNQELLGVSTFTLPTRALKPQL
jgi:hypothetical protein